MARDKTAIRFADRDPMRRALYLRGDFGPPIIKDGVFRRAISHEESEIVLMSLAAYCMLVIPEGLRPAVLNHENPKVRLLGSNNSSMTSREIDNTVRDVDRRVRFQAASRFELGEWQVGVLLGDPEPEISALTVARQRLTTAQSRSVANNAELQQLASAIREGSHGFAIASDISAVHQELHDTLSAAKRAYLDALK